MYNGRIHLHRHEHSSPPNSFLMNIGGGGNSFSWLSFRLHSHSNLDPMGANFSGIVSLVLCVGVATTDLEIVF